MRNKRKFKSPPLSPSEITDIQIAEKEIASGQCEIYDNVQNLINDLHKNRKQESE